MKCFGAFYCFWSGKVREDDCCNLLAHCNAGWSWNVGGRAYQEVGRQSNVDGFAL